MMMMSMAVEITPDFTKGPSEYRAQVWFTPVLLSSRLQTNFQLNFSPNLYTHWKNCTSPSSYFTIYERVSRSFPSKVDAYLFELSNTQLLYYLIFNFLKYVCNIY